LSDLSGAIEVFGGAVDGPVAVAEAFFLVAEGVVPVGIDMGGESTRHRTAINPKSPNSPSPQPEVERYRASWTV